MQVLISDANVLIDMEVGDLLEVMFQLPFQFKVADLPYHDELSADSRHHPLGQARGYCPAHPARGIKYL